MKITTINPSTGQPIRSYDYHTAREIDQRIDEAYDAWRQWRMTAFEQRSALLHRIADELAAQLSLLVDVMADEMGKPLSQGKAEIEKCIGTLRYYADYGAGMLRDEHIVSEASESFVTYQPLGPVLAIMPWNFPFWQVIRFAAPAMMAGNACLLKHAPNVTGCALMLQKIMESSGAGHLFKVLLAEVGDIERVIANPKVAAITLTGSTRAGSSVAALAGKYIKKTVLELGGSDPYIVLDDADMSNAAKLCATSRLINSGQSCVSAKRFIVTPKVKEAFTSLLAAEMQRKHFGDPHSPTTDLGPIARADLRDALHTQVMQSIAMGAICLTGGFIPASEGYFYPPTVLTNVLHGMPAYSEELFGPVAAIISARDEQDAVRIANDSIYGLGAAIFTNDIDKARALAYQQIDAGNVFINDFVRSDARLPFGGIKQSGYGRELSAFGIKEFTNIKTVFLK